MSSRKPPPVKEDISPNVVPMIDIMFLLLLFFMLGADMSQRESVDMLLAEADKVKETKPDDESQDPTVTVNIYHDANVSCPLNTAGRVCRDNSHWKWSVGGIDFTFDTLKPELQALADEFLEEDIDPLAQKRLSRRKVLVRADKNAPYGDIQKVIEVAGGVGIYKIEVAASKPRAAAQ